MFTKGEVNNYIEFEDKLKEFAEEFNDEFGYKDYIIDDVCIVNGILGIESTISMANGYYDTNYIECSVELLYDEDWKWTERTRLDDKIMEKTKAKAKESKKVKEENDKARYELYLKLKNEYESD